MSAEDDAILMIGEIKRALANGCLHYDPDTNALLSDPKAILSCLAAKGSVIVQEPLRCRCGHRVHGNDKALCPVCGAALPIKPGEEQKQ